MNLVAEKLDAAVREHQAGALARAEVLYLDVLRLEPTNLNASHVQGMGEKQQGEYHLAHAHNEKAVRRSPQQPIFQFKLLLIYQRLNEFEREIACFRRAIAKQPNIDEAYNSLGNA